MARHPDPSPQVHVTTVLGPMADTLLRRAAEILAAPPITRITEYLVASNGEPLEATRHV